MGEKNYEKSVIPSGVFAGSKQCPGQICGGFAPFMRGFFAILASENHCASEQNFMPAPFCTLYAHTSYILFFFILFFLSYFIGKIGEEGCNI